MIDGLVNVSKIYEYSGPPDPLIVKLGQLGFEAIPALIEHWDDPRLTRAANGKLIAICDVVRIPGRQDLPETGSKRTGMASRKRTCWPGGRRRSKPAKKPMSSLTSYRLSAEEKRSPNVTMLQIIAAKYPRHLPKIYRTRFSRSDLSF